MARTCQSQRHLPCHGGEGWRPAIIAFGDSVSHFRIRKHGVARIEYGTERHMLPLRKTTFLVASFARLSAARPHGEIAGMGSVYHHEKGGPLR